MALTSCWRSTNLIASRPNSSARCCNSSRGNSESWRGGVTPATTGTAGRFAASALAAATASLASGSGSSLTSGVLGEFSDIGDAISHFIDDAMRVPHDNERHAQQDTNEHVSAKSPNPQPQAMNHQVSAQHADVFLFPHQHHVPAPESLERDD